MFSSGTVMIIITIQIMITVKPTVFLGHPPVCVGGAGDLSGAVVWLMMPVEAQLTQADLALGGQRGEENRGGNVTAL